MAMMLNYSEALCDMIIAHCQKGFSVETFSAEYAIPPNKLREWYVQKEEFRLAVDLAVSSQQLYWEKTLKEAQETEDRDGQKTAQFMLDKIFKQKSFDHLKNLIKTEKRETGKVIAASDKDVLEELKEQLGFGREG